MTAPLLRRCALALGTLLTACGAGHGATLPQGTIVHGPFEIQAGVRRISTGTFPNQGGNPFAKREVSEFRVGWRGQRVVSPGGNDRFWRVLRLEGAPRPALLLVTQGFVLATEEAGQLKLQPLRAASNTLAEAQWLDSAAGQPGAVHLYGIQAVAELEAGTRLAGGRWLRLGSGLVIDVPTLTIHAIEPWVPHQPGVPITSLSRDGDEVRALSPRRSQYVLAASGYDHARNGAEAHGLLVVDIASGTAYQRRVDRQRHRYADTSDFTAEWVAHHFAWQADATGRETLVPRANARPWPWRGRLREMGAGRWQYELPRIEAAFLAELRRVAGTLPGFMAEAQQADGAVMLRSGACHLRAQAFGREGPADDRRIAVWIDTDLTAPPPACGETLKTLAAALDAELATGRHDALLLLKD